MLLDRLPASVIDVHLQLPTDDAGHTMIQPYCSQQCIISFLIEEQLSTMSQSRVDFAVSINVWCYHPGARKVVIVIHATLSYKDEKSNITLAPNDVY